MNWVNNQIELHARNIQTPEDAEAWHNKSTLKLSELIEKHAIPRGLEQMTPNSAIDYRFSSLWKWQEFKKTTFWGAKFTSIEEARNPFTNWTELIGLVANTVASSRAIIDQTGMKK